MSSLEFKWDTGRAGIVVERVRDSMTGGTDFLLLSKL